VPYHSTRPPLWQKRAGGRTSHFPATGELAVDDLVVVQMNQDDAVVAGPSRSSSTLSATTHQRGGMTSLHEVLPGQRPQFAGRVHHSGFVSRPPSCLGMTRSSRRCGLLSQPALAAAFSTHYKIVILLTQEPPVLARAYLPMTFLLLAGVGLAQESRDPVAARGENEAVSLTSSYVTVGKKVEYQAAAGRLPFQGEPGRTGCADGPVPGRTGCADAAGR